MQGSLYPICDFYEFNDDLKHNCSVCKLGSQYVYDSYIDYLSNGE
jgi:hypothetical protein